MEVHDLRKNSPSSGHEGHHQVHHCQKCGWPFPNPHPSAKHRRAHKRICGTIEGYKLEESPQLNVSDDEKSDDDDKTPSANRLERSENEKGSAGIDARLQPSEDEVFSDAVSNFGDTTSGTVTEEVLENVLERGNTIEKVKEDVPAKSTTAEVIQTDDTTASAKKQEPVLPERTANVLECKLVTHGHTSSSQIGIIGDSAEQSMDAIVGDNLVDNSVLIKPEPSIILVAEAKKPHEDIAVSECLSESASEDRVVKVVEEESIASSHDNSNASSILEAIPKAEEMFQTEDIKLSEESKAFLLDDNNANDIPEVTPVLEETCASVAIPLPSSEVSLSGNAPQVELEMGQKYGISTCGDNVHENDKGGEIERLQVFSLPHDLPLQVFSLPHDLPKVGNPETLIEGFKDHKNSGPTDFENSMDDLTAKNMDQNSGISTSADNVQGNDNDEEIEKFQVFSVPRDPEVENRERLVDTSEGILEKDKFVVTSTPESQPEAVKEVSEVSSDIQDPKDHSELVDGKSKPVEEEIITEGPRVSFSDHENRGPNDFEASKDDLADENMIVRAAVNASLSSDDQRVDDKSKVEVVHTMEFHQMEKHEEIGEILKEGEPASSTDTADTAEVDDNSKSHKVKSLIENLEVPESANIFHDVQVDVTGHPIAEDCTLINEKQGEEKLGIAEASEIISASSGQESLENDEISGNKETVMGTGAIIEENLKKGEMNGKEETADFSSQDRAVETNGKEETTQISSEDRAPETVLLPLDIPMVQASPLQREDEGNRVTEHVTGSALDASIDSRSTDSLDANWGSVSVISTQSDIPAAAADDSKAMSSTPGLPKSEPEAAKSSDKGKALESESYKKASNEPTDRKKKNEEIIAKVTNWSSNQQQQQHSPLKSLLMEANRDANKPPKSPNPKEEEEKSVTVSSVLGSEAPTKADEEKKQDAVAEEWKSPAKYSTEIKREKRKVKGRPYWAQFVCCSSSVN